ncbi:RING-H2 finger protein ATL47 [Rhynchospora pubera]|uniref:RING-H2 finger protein ATL47 n=1 Tax=Rhynchospora pubera TaxID=906938 RepID=A0AAV8GMH1_9POAL|nr:RING-H2 finger protein ATL47 [Rhynchospora pubera]KAJ4805464.1 RING-H2 finger protein ATL47 [Rhynchospora pubera]
MKPTILELTMQILFLLLLIFISASLLLFVFLLSVHAFVIVRVFKERSRNVSRMLSCNSNSSHGLSTEELETIPSYDFETQTGRMAKDCVVCLENFKDGEKCKILPNCGHTFHKICIDYWLLMNANCPVCRSSLSHKDIFTKNSFHLHGLR